MDNPFAEVIAQHFHQQYERLAPQLGYETRKASAVPWTEVPESNRKLMVATVDELLAMGIIEEGDALTDSDPVANPSYSQPETMQPRIQEVTEELDQQAAKRSGQTKGE